MKSLDEKKERTSVFKKVFIVLISIVSVVFLGFFLLLHIASQPTPDGKRINSDTDIRMLVDLPNATPSRAITFTTDKKRGEKGYEDTIEKYKTKAYGGVEGDIPSVLLEENPKIVLRFQDLHYNNLFPEEIKSLRADLTDMLSIRENKTGTSMAYTIQDGSLIIDPAQVEYEEHAYGGEIYYKIAFTVEYKYAGKDYTSVTAVIVLDK